MIHWIKILTTGANVAEIARDIYVTIKKNKKEQLEPGLPTIPDLQDKLKQLEDNELRQAALISKMAEQQKVFSNRLLVSYIISISSLAIAIISVLIHFFK